MFRVFLGSFGHVDTLLGAHMRVAGCAGPDTGLFGRARATRGMSGMRMGIGSKLGACAGTWRTRWHAQDARVVPFWYQNLLFPHQTYF